MAELPARAIPILSGLVGSRAYGLARPDSDHDRRGIYVWPTRDLLRLDAPPDHFESNGPGQDDTAWLEARKFLGLVLAGNPTHTELLWLGEYQVCNQWGSSLINIRDGLSAAPLIRRTYLGYATQQSKRLRERGDGSSSAHPRNRPAKHARHLYRLLMQGYDFYRPGTLTVRLPSHIAAVVTAFGEQVADGSVTLADALLARYEHLFDSAPPAGHRRE